MKQLTLPEIRQRLLGILIELNDFCEENNIHYYLCAGTLLGAIRHKGFIPWDDDIDIAMSRPFYDKLQDIARHNDVFHDHYKIVTYQNGTTHYPFMKVLDTETYTKQSYTNETNENSLWVDIFPFDGVPADINERRKLYQKELFVRKILNLNFAKVGDGKTMSHKLIKPLFMPFAKMYGIDRANKRIDELCRSYGYDRAEYVGDINWGDYDKEIMKKTDFDKPTYVTFEGHKFKTMSCWDQYLTDLYGDYMQLPPVDQRENHELKAWLREK